MARIIKRWLLWLQLRWPHTQSVRIDEAKPNRWFGCWRIYGLRAYYRLCLFDVTWTKRGGVLEVFGGHRLWSWGYWQDIRPPYYRAQVKHNE